jgi:sulfite exporter TauE/SafE
VIEKKLLKYRIVKNVDVVLHRRKIYFELSEDTSRQSIISGINSIINEDGYSISEERGKHKIRWADLLKGAAAAAIIIGFFILLQRLGVANLLEVDDLTLPVVFLIGIIASLSSCMAVVGGLVLSVSTSYAKTGQKTLPLLFFHAARIAGFFILGGVLGALGSVFEINQIAYFIISAVLFIVMVVLGLNLLAIFPFLAAFQLRVPKVFMKKIVLNENIQNRFTPVFLGLVTFFLPCGFTQSMQLSAMTSGNFLNGGIFMTVFALGTLPVLGIISFTSIKFSSSRFSKVFFKAAGFIVLFFAVYNFIGALVSMGFIAPVF